MASSTTSTSTGIVSTASSKALPAERASGGLLALLALGVALLAAAALLIGPYRAGPVELLRSAAGLLGLRDATEGSGSAAATVLLSIRLPRVAAALLVGAALAAAGTTYQGIFRNPLASPDILGVSAGAGMGAVVGIFLSLPVPGIQLLAFVAGMGTVAIVWAIAVTVRGHDPVIVLVLAGVVVGALAGAVVSLLKVLADPYDQLPAITFWLLGSLAHVTAGDVLATAPLVLLGLLPLHLLRWRLNLLTLGDEEAAALGADVRRLRALAVVGATLATAAVVAISGTIGWIGLVVPHLCRMLVGPDLLRLLPCATIVGAGFLLLVDTIARSAAGTEIPLGILTSLLGAPFFLWLLARGGRRGWSG